MRRNCFSAIARTFARGDVSDAPGPSQKLHPCCPSFIASGESDRRGAWTPWNSGLSRRARLLPQATPLTMVMKAFDARAASLAITAA